MVRGFTTPASSLRAYLDSSGWARLFIACATLLSVNFLYSYLPHPIAFQFGPITVYWYGLFMALGALVAFIITWRLARRAGLPVERLFDLAVLALVIGFIGARLYHVLNEPVYYWQHPIEIFQVWRGGLAIHGGLIAGGLTLWFGSKHLKFNFWRLTDLIAPGLLLGLAIGRLGNYFNQELFGQPTGLPWGIPVGLANRPLEYLSSGYFHPTFLYELIIDAVSATLLFFLLRKNLNKYIQAGRFGLITAYFFVLYGVGRLTAEYFRIDRTPHILGVRLPLIVSVVIILLGVGLWLFISRRKPDSSEHICSLN